MNSFCSDSVLTNQTSDYNLAVNNYLVEPEMSISPFTFVYPDATFYMLWSLAIINTRLWEHNFAWNNLSRYLKKWVWGQCYDNTACHINSLESFFKTVKFLRDLAQK